MKNIDKPTFDAIIARIDKEFVNTKRSRLYSVYAETIIEDLKEHFGLPQKSKKEK